MQRASVATRHRAILQSVDVHNYPHPHPPIRPSLTVQPTPPAQVDEDDDDPDFKRATANSQPGRRVPILLIEIKPFSLTPARSATIENKENEFEDMSVVSCELLLALNWEAEAVVVTEGYAGCLSAAVRASRRRLFVLVKLDTKQSGARILKWLRPQLLEHINKKRHNDNNNSIVGVSTPARDTALVPWSMFRVHAVLDWSSMVRSLLFLSERHMFRGQAAVDLTVYAFYQEAARWAADIVRRGELLRSDDPFFRAHEDFDHELILLFERAHYRHELVRAHVRDAA